MLKKQNILCIVLVALFSFSLGLLSNRVMVFLYTDYICTMDAKITSVTDDLIEVTDCTNRQETYSIKTSSIGFIFNNKFRPMHYLDLKTDQNIIIQFHVKRFGKQSPELINGETLIDVETILIK